MPDQYGIVSRSERHFITVVTISQSAAATGVRGRGAESSVSCSPQVEFALSFGTNSETAAEFRAHQVIQDRISRRIQIDHYPAKVQDVVIFLVT